MKRDKRTKAIRNNNDLYEAVLKPHGITSHRTGSIWYCLAETPPLYSNLVTLSAQWQPDGTFRRIDEICRRENWEEWSVKDSFAVLDPGEYGFRKLFDACWLYLEAENFRPVKLEKKIDYRIVKNEETLSVWRKAWAADEELGQRIFRPEMTADPKVFFIAGFQDEKIASGCLLNKTEDVLGISNFFAPDESIEYWSDLIGFILNAFGRTDLVGYERKDLAGQLASFGFETVGHLTVWLKS